MIVGNHHFFPQMLYLFVAFLEKLECLFFRNRVGAYGVCFSTGKDANIRIDHVFAMDVFYLIRFRKEVTNGIILMISRNEQYLFSPCNKGADLVFWILSKMSEVTTENN